MNRFGKMALDHWRRHRPNAFAKLQATGQTEPFFTELGETCAERSHQLFLEMLASQGPAADFLAEVNQREQIQRSAEEIVLSEQVLLPEEASSGPTH